MGDDVIAVISHADAMSVIHTPRLETTIDAHIAVKIGYWSAAATDFGGGAFAVLFKSVSTNFGRSFFCPLQP